MGALVDYTKLPTDYVDRYTPEVARREGIKIGTHTAFKSVLYYLQETKKPTFKNLIALLEAAIERETNDEDPLPFR